VVRPRLAAHVMTECQGIPIITSFTAYNVSPMITGWWQIQSIVDLVVNIHAAVITGWWQVQSIVDLVVNIHAAVITGFPTPFHPLFLPVTMTGCICS
jgi:hypothetical protein